MLLIRILTEYTLALLTNKLVRILSNNLQHVWIQMNGMSEKIKGYLVNCQVGFRLFQFIILQQYRES